MNDEFQKCLKDFAILYINLGFTNASDVIKECNKINGKMSMFKNIEIIQLFTFIFLRELIRIKQEKRDNGKSQEFITAAKAAENVDNYEELVALREFVDKRLSKYKQHKV